MRLISLFVLAVLVKGDILSQSILFAPTSLRDSLQAESVLRGHKDFYLLLGIGTGELLGARADVQVFRGIYVGVGYGVSFVPLPTGDFLCMSHLVKGDLTWRWYSRGLTPLATVRLGLATWSASSYKANGGTTIEETKKGAVREILIGGEYRGADGRVTGIVIGANWWNSSGLPMTKGAEIQFYGGISF